MLFDHIADAIKAPAVIRIGQNLYLARFETMKVYSTLVAVRSLLDRRLVRPGDTLLDSSSGIYAYALALACHKFGMKCHIVGSQTIDLTLLVQLQILGATVEQVPPLATLKLDQSRRVERVAELLAADPAMHWMRQYHDDIHYLGYEPVAAHLAGLIDVRRLTLVGSVGSGCSTGGLATALRRRDDTVAMVGIQPFGSVTFGSERVADPGIIIAGIGSSIPFGNVRHELYDWIHWVSFDAGMAGAVALLRDHGIFAGLSSGCTYLVGAHEAMRRPDRDVLLIAPDTGHRYTDAVFARHAEAAAPGGLAPRTVETLDDLALPWSTLAWNRRSFADVRERPRGPFTEEGRETPWRIC